MNLLNIEKMSKSFTDKVLFDRVTLGIGEGDKIGVIGINGTGKSTLLKMIAGLEEPDEGSVTKGKTVRVEYLAQTPVFSEDLTILENVITGKKAAEEYRNLEGEAKTMLVKLGLEEYNGRVDTLSGGQKKRVALVRTLLTPAQILVLDEPTNHLDNEMAEWLEDYLSKYQGAFIMVTHDRYFLDKVTNKIVEIDKGNLYTYAANYTKFLQLKAEREDMEQASERKKKSLYRMDLEWMMRGARARSTKQKAHIQRFEELRDRKVLEKDKSVELNALSSRLGKKTVEIEHISKAFGEKVLIKDFNYIMLKNDRLGIVGPNGSGKTTLLKIITGYVEPDEGQVITGETVKIGYFSQENEYMDQNLKVIEYIRNVAEYIETSEGSASASQMLERFLFTGAMQYSQIAKLSGGERRRLYLLKVLMEAPNVLILDEPTNDLDIQTLTILEDYLDSYDGIVLTVSHDRYFLDRVVNRIFAFEGKGVITQYEGGFSDYKENEARKEKAEGISDSNKSSDTPSKNSAAGKNSDASDRGRQREVKLKFSYHEQKEYDEIDNVIAGLEDSIALLEVDIAKEASNYSKLNDLMAKKEELEQQLEEKMDRWVYLNDLAEQIENAKNK
ncbi:ABC-F family ATP-binding cassette domain-containing protein [Anaerocolumna sp. AGMB13025]|uniref:ABC-F family ATP-binding cassette domain-containing protein n=1 Tax=Anaerocolumna sp. AGMB13025 TaxID=3039116 RepID=UPI00241DBE50|nr:ABC-F family ATP-binding cassette domain-containing protein [Anaerocolumna sp. AGMB13025]WFR57417.1 ABC-F family ATP-binding cassette domain-containing protein [Anaerocolumna sp. AGMB13025]